MFGICLLSHIAGRREGSDKSEMVTQLLFGDAYAVVEVQEKWVKIKTHFDDYDCWISKNQHFEITEKTYGELLSAPLVLSDDLVQVVQEGSTYLPIVMGSTLPLFKDGELVHMLERHHIEGRPAELIAENLQDAYAEFC